MRIDWKTGLAQAAQYLVGDPGAQILVFDNFRTGGSPPVLTKKIRLGSTTINKLYIGSEEISKAYLGSILVHEQ